jgi:hypothetical protein
MNLHGRQRSCSRAPGVTTFGSIHPLPAASNSPDDGTGGVITECEWGNDVAAENVHAVYEAWEENEKT